MDLTEGTLQEKTARSKKMMLWFGIGSLIMSFSALISAFIVSSKQRRDKDWLNSYDLPNAFYISVAIILLSSLTFVLAKKALKQKNRQMTSVWLFVTLALGIAFIFSQLEGFNQIIQTGYNFTGPTSNITMSYIYLIAVVHILHVIAGLICIVVVIYNHFKQKYNANNMLGLELAANFWHFIDLLWLVLFLFLYFFRDII
ncbi:MAG: cytochrome oxidase subunit III [Flavobacteriaceae bacterium]|uniref:cytochrome c oxidase subunit 3 n=1 Tax=Olleya sp. UBA1516 TaxID=1947013 RepID=UPI000C907D81|nr:cytochrome c oxidase subunit 3 [Olleya sp. UBA1516]MAB47021.1 cytochrome oxidase subunit III [Flavobacteriaceae bacterium]|tara:strand:+ start:34466 stop:35065 length:600 start_codon:yes stop_codon:yes gene_type:complete